MLSEIFVFNAMMKHVVVIYTGQRGRKEKDGMCMEINGFSFVAYRGWKSNGNQSNFVSKSLKQASSI